MMRDSLHRRKRHRRAPSGKKLRLTNRDFEILSLLNRYRFLTSKDLLAYFKPKSSKRFIERLGQLYHEAALLDRPKEQFAFGNTRYAPAVYSLAPKGFEHLLSEERKPRRAVVWPTGQNGGVRMQFTHTLLINQTICTAEIEARGTPGQRFVCLDEIKQRQLDKGRHFKLEFEVRVPPSSTNPYGLFHTKVRPDGLYGIEYTDSGKPLYRFFAVEVECTSPKRRSSPRLSSTLKKQLAYDAAINSEVYKDALGIPNLALRILRRGQLRMF